MPRKDTGGESGQPGCLIEAARPGRELEMERLNRLYASLIEISQAVSHSGSRDELFQKVCRVLVERGGFQLAWIGLSDEEAGILRPAAQWGDSSGYLERVKIGLEDDEAGRGPTGRAFRERRACICNDALSDPSLLPWRAEFKRLRFCSSAALPILVEDHPCAALSVYAGEAGFFQDAEMRLLMDATREIAFALEALVREEIRRQAEAVARRETHFSSAMFESMPGIVYFYDLHGRFLRWNRNFSKVSGYSDGEIAHMHPLQFFTGEDKILIERRIAEVFDKGEASVEARFVTRDGRAIPYFFTGRRLEFDGQTCLVGMGIDIRERKEAEERLARSERQYRELVEHANSIILRWNSEGRITFLNEFGLRFFGYAEAEILGRHVVGTIVPDTESGGRDLRELMDQICADPKAFEQNVNENVLRDGRRVSIAWTNRIVRDDSGSLVEILSIGSDITELKKNEEAIRELNATLERRVAERTAELAIERDRAEAADRLKSAFLATMSHELRTPLNSIIGFTGIVLQGLAGPLNEEQARQLGMVRNSARHLLELINDVLDISKIEAGQLEVSAEPFDLLASIVRATGTVKPMADKKGLALVVEAPESFEPVISDRRRVEQILLNLLNNAIKFTDRGEVRLTAELVPDYSPALDSPPEPVVRLQVTDTGIGIKPANLSLLFQPFRQVDTGLTRQHEGTGLGLAICRRLADLLGGTIFAESEWGRGSTFTFILPLAKRP